MKVVLVILGFVAIASCMPTDPTAVEATVAKILAALKDTGKTEAALAVPEVPVKPDNATAQAKSKRAVKPNAIQITDAKSDEPDGIAISTSDLTTKADPAPPKRKRSGTTAQTTTSEGNTAVSSAKLQNQGTGTAVQSTSSKGHKLAIATSSMTTGSDAPVAIPETPAVTVPETPVVDPVAPAPVAPAPIDQAPVPESSAPAVEKPVVTHPVTGTDVPTKEVVTPAGISQSVNPATGEKLTQVVAP